MVMLAIYFDESYNYRTQKEPDIPLAYTVAGYLSSTEQWKEFEREWGEVLGKEGIEYFHMADFESRIGIYRTWSNEKRIEFLQQLHKIIQKYVLKAFAVSIAIEDFESLTEREKFIFGDPHMCALISCMKHLKTLFDGSNLKEPIAYVFEGHQTYDKTVSALFAKFDDYEKSEYHIGSLSFVNKKCLPTQAADMLAYEVNKEYAQQLCANRKRKTRASIRNLRVEGVDIWFHMDKRYFLEVIDFIKAHELYDAGE